MALKKIAENNPDFERSFADLAYARIKDKAPKLLDFMVGFQVLDKTEDETRAAGIFGFQVGKQWFYAPIFFINGELKGYELLYIKDQDAFVPLQENWVNYLISRRPQQVGGGTPFNESELGVIAPNFRVYARSPLRGWDKTAGYVKGSNVGPCTFEDDGIKAAGYWYTGKMFDVMPALPCFTISPNHDVYKQAAARMDLAKLIPGLGVKAAKWVAAQVAAQPKLASALGKFYKSTDFVPANVKAAAVSELKPVSDSILAKHGLDRDLFKYYTTKLARANAVTPVGTDKVVLRILMDHGVKSAAHLRTVLDTVLAEPIKSAAKEDPGTEKTVKVISRREGMDNPEKLSDTEKEELMHDGVVVHDERPDSAKSKIYDINMLDVLTNPTKSGLYDMLGKDGKSYPVLIVMGPKTIGAGVADIALVTRTDGEGFDHFDAKDILVNKERCGDWKEFYDKLPSVNDMKVGEKYLVVGPSGEGSLVFGVVSKDGSEYQVHVLEGHYVGSKRMSTDTKYCHGRVNHDYPTQNVNDKAITDFDGVDYWKHSVRPVVVTGKAQYLKPIGDTLMVPDRYKVFKISGQCPNIGFAPGTLTDAELLLWKQAGLSQIRVYSDGLGYQIDYGTLSPRMQLDDAYKTLIVQHGTSKSAAQMMLKRADAKGHDTFYIKQAATYRTTGGPLTPGPNAPPMSQLDNIQGYDANLKANVSMPQVTYEPVGMPLGSYEDYNPEVMDKQTTQSVMSAAQSGQKEVLDTAVLSGMLKTMNTESMIDKYLGDLVTGEDRIGRMLFLFYWHNDKFVDRYGEKDMRELEDVLTNTFKGVGDLILFLKKKSIEPDVANMGTDVDLGKISGQESQ